MKNLKFKLVLLFFALFATVSPSFSQIPDEIVLSIQSGNDVMLASYFNQNVELVVQSHDDVFSKSQAQQIVAEFFKANKPKQFSIIHQGGKDGARYAIGSLVTNTGTFRVYFLLKNKDNNSYIHQLRIEKQG
ncbi:MAG: DUF4783 domain-containing protein [Bacteroidota bacterium]|jgi:hypothetical protein|nr:DUF4783 domain-containing protein [Bacteroidota bacterium]MDP3432020.1 DUF4783 domain-containing protein [Bacteroidota bacterium]MDP3914332.1 DUF4783 domain-containing protein [Bacteroidota bacterium]